jgi:hypothetical protein
VFLPRLCRVRKTAATAARHRLARNIDIRKPGDVDLVFDLPRVPPGAMRCFLLAQIASTTELEADQAALVQD